MASSLRRNPFNGIPLGNFYCSKDGVEKKDINVINSCFLNAPIKPGRNYSASGDHIRKPAPVVGAPTNAIKLVNFILVSLHC